MKHLCAAATLLLCRITFTPSLEVAQVNDDNLNFSPTHPLSDRVRRVTPSLGLTFESPRSSGHIAAGFDSEQYQNRTALNDTRARERAEVAFRIKATQRVEMTFNGDFMSTNTLADLNQDTALAAARLHGRETNARPSLTFRLTPATSARVSMSSMIITAAGGFGTRSEDQTVGLDHHTTPRDVFGFDLTHGSLAFSGIAPQTFDTTALIGGWTHDVGPRDRLMLQAGPRLTDGTWAADLRASLTHTGRDVTANISMSRAQTTVIGYNGPLLTDSVQGTFSWNARRNVTLFAAPGVFRSTATNLEALVYRTSAGVRYGLTSFLEAEVAYNHDRQNGTATLQQPYAGYKHNVLSVGFVTRKSAQ